MEEPTDFSVGYERIEEIITYVTKTMIALGLSIPQQGVQGQANPLMIQLNVTQEVNQLTAVRFDQLIEMIQKQENISKEVKEAATKAVKEFNVELEQPNPNPSKLKSCLDIVLKAGKEYGIPLLFKILENWNKMFHWNKPTVNSQKFLGHELTS